MPQTFGVGVIGCGLIGQKRIRSLPSNCRVVGLFDQVRQVSDIAAASVPYAITVCDSFEEVLNDPRIDLVVVATSHRSLARIAESAASHRKHVLIEKPGAVSSAALQTVRASAAATGVVVHVGFNHRFHPAMLMTRQIVDSNKYGGLIWLRGRYGHGGRLGYEKEWRANRAESGGGELLDQGSHLIDLTRFFFGDVTLLYSRLQTEFWDMDVEDNAFLALEPRTGGTAWLHASWTDWKNTFSLEITLRNAKIDIQGLGGSYGTETLTIYEMQPEMGPPPSKSYSWNSDDESWRLEFEDFLAAVSGAHSIGATIDDAVAVLEVVERGYLE